MKPEEILAELKVAKERIEFLENELKKPEKFEFKYERGESFIIYSDEIYSEGNGDVQRKLDFGLYRISENNAKEAVQLNKESNLIGAIAEQIDVEYSKDIDWNSIDNKYSISYDYQNKKFFINCNNYLKILGAVYMTKEVSERVCEILNNKEVEL